MSNFGRTEKIIFTVAALALLAFSYFLYDDSLLFPKAQNSRMELIGDVTTSQNDVRRKNLDNFSWLPASKKDKVFQSDSIFTGDRSEASIQLKDGSIIRVRSNSLITLNMKNGQMSLDLRYGDLEAELSKNASLIVKSGAEEFKLENDVKSTTNSKVEFKKSHSKNVNLKLLSGQAKLNKAALSAEANVSISQTGKIKEIPKVATTYEAPAETYFLRANPDDPLPFSWKSSQPAAKYQIEIASDDGFSSSPLVQTSTNPSLEVREPLAEGTYFWRIKSFDSDGQLSAKSTPLKFHLSYLKAPEIVTPVTQTQIDLEVAAPKTGPLTSTTQVRWQAMNQLQKFNWQISQDPEFKTLFKEQETTEKEFATPALESGTYFVRVRGTTAQGTLSPWSASHQFALNLTAKKGPVRPNAPVLVSNKVDFKIPQGADRNPAAVKGPALEWKPVAQSSAYVLQISKDISFAEATRQDITSTSVAWAQYRPGKFFFRVYAKSPQGLVSVPSEVGTIDITSDQPVLNPISPIKSVGQTQTAQEAAVSWSEVPYAQKYLVEIDKSGDFKTPTQFEYTTASGKIKIPEPGSYKVRVQALDNENKAITEYSNIEELLYSFRSPLVSPTLAEPFNNASIFLQKEMEPFIWLEWKKVKGATNYKIEVSDRSDFSRILVSKSLPENRFLVKERLPLGKIYWRVRAEIPQDKEYSEWATLREFTIYHQKNEIFVK